VATHPFVHICNLVAGLALVLAIFNSAEVVRTGIALRGALSEDPRHVVDGKTYLTAAHVLTETDRWIFTRDCVHSVGMQIATNVMQRLFGRPDFYPVKMLNLAAWLGVGILSFFFFNALFQSWRIAAIGTAMVSESELLRTYALTLQYEILACFLLMTWAMLILSPHRRWKNFCLGLVIALLAVLRPHFLSLLPLTLIPIPKRSRFEVLIGFLGFALPYNAYFSWRLETFYFFYQFNVGYPLAGSLNELSRGYNFPRNPQGEVFGLQFILQKPIRYLELLSLRFFYYVGFIKDVWWVELWPTLPLTAISMEYTSYFDRPLRCLLLLLTGYGIWRVLRGYAKSPHLPTLLIPLVVVTSPLLLINSSTRFLTPLVPFLIAIQFIAVGGLVDRFAKS